MLIGIEHDDREGQNMGGISALDFGFNIILGLPNSKFQVGSLLGPDAK